MYIQLITWEYIGQALWSCKRFQISNYILLLIKFPSIGNFSIYKNGQIIAILQIAIYKNGQIIAICQIAIHINSQINAIWQICQISHYRESLQIILILQIALSKNGQNATNN
jgi:hypothetical protein